MSDTPRGTRISAAQSIDPQPKKGPNLTEQFNKAKSAQLEQQQAQKAAGSDMVKKDRPQHNLNPPEPGRSAVVRNTYNAALNKERTEAAKRTAEAVKARNSSQNSSNLKNERGNKNNDDRSR